MGAFFPHILGMQSRDGQDNQNDDEEQFSHIQLFWMMVLWFLFHELSLFRKCVLYTIFRQVDFQRFVHLAFFQFLLHAQLANGNR